LVPGLLLAFAGSAGADWVDLKSGASLRGIDFKRHGNLRSFTLESGRVVLLEPDQIAGFRRSPRGEKVEFRGKQVSLREKVRTLQLEEKRREARALRDIEKWARGKSGSEEARAAFEEIPPIDRQRYLARAITRSRLPVARALAARELGKSGGEASLVVLSSAAIADRQPIVRSACLTALRTLDDPSTPDRFLPYLRSPAREVRVRAAQAIEAFPTRRAAPVLIQALRRTWADFGRGYIFQGTRRSYIKDYNLVSGGTGFSILEVADPEVDVVSTGVVLDAKVRRVEIISYVRALRKISGRQLGADPREWQAWWKESRKEPGVEPR
jgi:hypothetical protein